MFFLSAQGAQKKHRFKIFIPGDAVAIAMQNSCSEAKEICSVYLGFIIPPTEEIFF
jgi:hypothetical protein